MDHRTLFSCQEILQHENSQVAMIGQVHTRLLNTRCSSHSFGSSHPVCHLHNHPSRFFNLMIPDCRCTMSTHCAYSDFNTTSFGVQPEFYLSSRLAAVLTTIGATQQAKREYPLPVSPNLRSNSTASTVATRRLQLGGSPRVWIVLPQICSDLAPRKSQSSSKSWDMVSFNVVSLMPQHAMRRLWHFVCS
jgi:hypothetical protein